MSFCISDRGLQRKKMFRRQGWKESRFSSSWGGLWCNHAMSTFADSRRKAIQPTLARLPPLTSLRAFVATARHLNFVRAAEELHVTSAAVGQQIRLLEDYLGQPLFNRVRGQLNLTPAGLALVPGLTGAFDAVLTAMAQFVQSDHEQPIRVSVAPSFASKWLIPRLDALRRAAPRLQVLVDASTQLTNLDAGDADCVIRYGSGPYPGLIVDHLFSEAVLPVCSPEFADTYGLWGKPEAIEDVPLLHEEGAEHDQSCPDWGGWLRAAGLSYLPSQGGFRLNQSSLVLDAALAGQGLGLGKIRLAEAEIRSGRLVCPFGVPQPVSSSYFFATTAHAARLMRVDLFREWLLAEARALQTMDEIIARRIRPAADMMAAE
ncbi:LysR family glycine cleavage system transcriptional activator [Rhizobium sp. 57MFTsu3.2]|nr:LysR family glycine cleavage system transcriptional activator [Rhizobium sp. 57MFTsu3.2]